MPLLDMGKNKKSKPQRKIPKVYPSGLRAQYQGFSAHATLNYAQKTVTLVSTRRNAIEWGFTKDETSTEREQWTLTIEARLLDSLYRAYAYTSWKSGLWELVSLDKNMRGTLRFCTGSTGYEEIENLPQIIKNDNTYVHDRTVIAKVNLGPTAQVATWGYYYNLNTLLPEPVKELGKNYYTLIQDHWNKTHTDNPHFYRGHGFEFPSSIIALPFISYAYLDCPNDAMRLPALPGQLPTGVWAIYKGSVYNVEIRPGTTTRLLCPIEPNDPGFTRVTLEDHKHPVWVKEVDPGEIWHAIHVATLTKRDNQVWSVHGMRVRGDVVLHPNPLVPKDINTQPKEVLIDSSEIKELYVASHELDIYSGHPFTPDMTPLAQQWVLRDPV